MNYMQLALEQAFLAVGKSRPNPAVGAIVVKDGIIVGKGHTQTPGCSHAEVMALLDAGELAYSASLFVTLEPCTHYGRTPPCTNAIIKSGIKKVFFAYEDPNPLVRGNCKRILEKSKIEVFEGEYACNKAFMDFQIQNDSFDNNDFSQEKCKVFGYNESLFSNQVIEGRNIYNEIKRFYEAYDYFVRKKRTFVEIKSAVSENGFMGFLSKEGKKNPLKITSLGANIWNHELRAMSDAILIGVGTLLSDNPRLDVRYFSGNNPVKIIWAFDHEFSLEEISKIFLFKRNFSLGDSVKQKTESLIIFSQVKQRYLENEFDVYLLKENIFKKNWEEMLDVLTTKGMHRLMVEPGEFLINELFSGKSLWNRLDLWRSLKDSVDSNLDFLLESEIAQKGIKFPDLPANVIAKESAMIGDDILTVYYPLG